MFFFALETITLPLECDCSPFARISEKDIARCCVKTCHVLRWCGDTDAHLRKGFSAEHAQELSLQRVPCQNAPSPVESLPAAPSCAGWAWPHEMSRDLASSPNVLFFHLVFRIASNCRHSHSPLLPDRQTAAGSDVAHMCAAKLLHNGIRVQQWSHTTTRQALWYNAKDCHANASDANEPGTSQDRDIVTMVDIFFFCRAWVLDDLLA